MSQHHIVSSMSSAKKVPSSLMRPNSFEEVFLRNEMWCVTEISIRDVKRGNTLYLNSR